MTEYFSSRRSCRSFTGAEVPESLISSLIREAANAPTTGNMQLYSVVVTRDPARKDALAGAHFRQPATGAPVLLTFCADLRRFSRWCGLSDAEPCYDNLQGLTTALLDTVIFAQQFNTIAEMHGLGCCYLGTTTYSAAQISEMLHLPRLVLPVVTIAVGWPAALSEDPGRLPADCLIHTEEYHDPSDEEIRRAYAEKEAREDSRRFVEENGKQTLAQVFTDVRYTRPMMEGTSGPLKKLIEDAGFHI